MNKAQRTKIKGGVHIVFAPLQVKNVVAWLTNDNTTKFVFVSTRLDRQQRGRMIRRGLRFHEQREVSH